MRVAFYESRFSSMIGQTQCKTCKKFKLGFAEWGRERKEETKTEGGGLIDRR